MKFKPTGAISKKEHKKQFLKTNKDKTELKKTEKTQKK